MAAQRKQKRRRVKVRNPLAPVVRTLTPRVKPSAKAYIRKPKHTRPPDDDGGGNR